MKRQKWWWLKVTHDEYELPVAVATTVSELGKILNISSNDICASMTRSRKYGWWSPYRKVERNEDEEN